MPGYGFKTGFVPKCLAGTKPHTIRAPRKDGKVPQVGTPFMAYHAMRQPTCTWLFDSTIVKVEVVLIARPPHMHQRLSTRREYRHGLHVEIMDRDLYDDDLEAFAKADGFDDVAGFQRHFLPRPKDLQFVGYLIHWNPQDAIDCARRHACRDCGVRLEWSPECKTFICHCPTHNFERHYLRRLIPLRGQSDPPPSLAVVDSETGRQDCPADAGLAAQFLSTP